ncbi:hypothetical protein GCM10027063_40440 [Promicromonospora xylanilytica]
MVYPDSAAVGDVIGRNLCPKPRFVDSARVPWTAGTVADETISGTTHKRLGAFTDTSIQLPGLTWVPGVEYTVTVHAYTEEGSTLGLAALPGDGQDAGGIEWQTFTTGWYDWHEYTFTLAITDSPPVDDLGNDVDPEGVFLRFRAPTSNDLRVAAVRVDDTGSVVPGVIDGDTTDTTDFDFGWDGTAGASTSTVLALTAFGEVDPGPDPDPEPTTLAASVAAFLDATDDPDLIALAGQHVTVMEALVRAHTRGKGFTPEGAPYPDVEAVIIAATARLIANPEQTDNYAGGAGVRGGFVGFSLPELITLNTYRRRTA